MDDHAIADESMSDRDIRPDRAIAADAHIGADHGVGADHGSRADLRARADDGTGIDANAAFHARARMHHRTGRDAGNGTLAGKQRRRPQRVGKQRARHLDEGVERLLHDQQCDLGRNARRRADRGQSGTRRRYWRGPAPQSLAWSRNTRSNGPPRSSAAMPVIAPCRIGVAAQLRAGELCNLADGNSPVAPKKGSRAHATPTVRRPTARLRRSLRR